MGFCVANAEGACANCGWHFRLWQIKPWPVRQCGPLCGDRHGQEARPARQRPAPVPAEQLTAAFAALGLPGLEVLAKAPSVRRIVERWIRAGSKMRTPEEVAAIAEKVVGCPKLRVTTCMAFGCPKTQQNLVPCMMIAKMASEKCPQGRF